MFKRRTITTGTQARTNPPWLPGLTSWAEASWALKSGLSTLYLMWWAGTHGQGQKEGEPARPELLLRVLQKHPWRNAPFSFAEEGTEPHSPERTTTNLTWELFANQETDILQGETAYHPATVCVGQTKITWAILVFLSPWHENSAQMVSPWQSEGKHLLGYTQHNPDWTPFEIQTVALSCFTDWATQTVFILRWH